MAARGRSWKSIREVFLLRDKRRFYPPEKEISVLSGLTD